MAAADLLARRETHFVLWRPAVTTPAPELVIGIFRPGNPPGLDAVRVLPLAPSAEFPELWERAAAGCGLVDGEVYHYWFRVGDSFPAPDRTARIDITDPFATTVDWRLVAPWPGPPYTDDDRDPASVILFRGGRLVPCDPGGETADWSGDAAPHTLAPNNRMVIYELPTRWTRGSGVLGTELSAGTFRDVLALVEPAETGANFEGMAALGAGRAHLRELGVNALELLPPADSWVGREWGYATSNYLAADFDLGFPEGHESPTATTDLVSLVRACHAAGMRFIPDVVMAFATRAPMENLAYLDFHIARGTGDPEEDAREDFGGRLLKYNYRVMGFDPASGVRRDLVPARQWMKTFLAHWMRFYRADGVRMDSVVNFNNWDFIGEFRNRARELWRERWKAQSPAAAAAGAEARFLTIAEELAVPVNLVTENRVDALWNEHFKRRLREVLVYDAAMAPGDFLRRVEEMIDCRRLGFRDGAEAVNYVTSHDVEGFRNERLYNFLGNNGVALKQERIQLAFACLLTAVGVPMIFAGEEFADEHDLAIAHPSKQMDPVNFTRAQDPWRRRVFDYVARLVRFRTASDALALNDTRFLHADFTGGRRVVVWQRGGDASGTAPVVVVANFSDWSSGGDGEYRVPNWPGTPAGSRWREVTQERDVPAEWVGREPLFAWEAKVYALVN